MSSDRAALPRRLPVTLHHSLALPWAILTKMLHSHSQHPCISNSHSRITRDPTKLAAAMPAQRFTLSP